MFVFVVVFVSLCFCCCWLCCFVAVVAGRVKSIPTGHLGLALEGTGVVVVCSSDMVDRHTPEERWDLSLVCKFPEPKIKMNA